MVDINAFLTTVDLTDNKIKTLIIENFESHKYTVINFSRGYNVFIGESRNGKSSALRSLRWVYYNEPRGDKFKRVGEKETRVTVELFNGFCIARELTPSKNRYIINHEKLDESVILEGFGIYVPYEVQQILGCYEVKVDDKTKIKLNYMKQGEDWFLIGNMYPATVKSKIVGMLAGVHYIDKAIRDTKTDLDRANRRANFLEEEIARLKNNEKQYEYLDDLKNKIQVLESILVKANELEIKNDKLISFSSQYQTITQKHKKVLDDIKELSVIYDVEEKFRLAQEKLLQEKNLLSLKKQYEDILKKLDICKEIIATKDKIESAYYITQSALLDFIKLKHLLSLSKSYDEINKKLINCQETIKLKPNNEKAQLIIKEVEKKLIAFNKLIFMREQLEIIISKIKSCTKIISYKTNVDTADKYINTSLFKIEQNKKLLRLMTEYRKNLMASQKIEYILKHKKNTFKADELVAKSQNTLLILKKLLELEEKYTSVNTQINGEMKTREELQERLLKEIDQYEALLREIGNCPTCMHEIDSFVIDKLVKELKIPNRQV